MKQGFITSVMADYSFEQVVDFASENGFECLEVACWPKGKAERKYAGVTHIDVSTLDSFKAEEILRYCKDRKVTISALAYYPNVLDEDDECRKKSIDHLMQVINAAAELKVNMVTTFIGRNQNLNVSDNLALAEKIWKPILNYAENRGVKIAIENCPMLFTEDEWPGGKNLAISPAIWRELFKRLPSDMLGLNFDPSHFIWQEMDYIKPLYEFKDKIFHVHYKDNAGYLEPLDDVLTDEVKAAYPESFIEMSDGKGVPMFMEIFCFWLNSKYVKEAGMDSIQTKDEFVEFLEKVSKDNVYGYGGGWEQTYVWNDIGEFINLFGGDLYDWSNPQTQEAVKFLKEMVNNGWTAKSQIADQYTELNQRIMDGSVASMLNYSSFMPTYDKAGRYGKDDIYIAPMLNLGEEKTYANGWQYVLNAASTRKENAKIFLKWAASLEGQKVYAEHFPESRQERMSWKIRSSLCPVLKS